jgi:lipopolysaccharide/colanic/teichoic acid biosynthesis glycosyltransferase
MYYNLSMPKELALSALKRGFDVIAASAAIILLLPLLCLIALAIKVSGGGPLLFRCPWIGLNGAV